MRSPAGAALSFGVISFYKAQTDAILRALETHGVTRRGPEGGWEVDREFAELPGKNGKPAKERLRIGTVDAFQGMEFDAVLLSVVRSEHAARPGPRDEGWARSVYGHLLSPNRLCVSMSRQQRLLTVVGDAAMAEGDAARAAVPGLAAFRALCREYPEVKP